MPATVIDEPRAASNARADAFRKTTDLVDGATNQPTVLVVDDDPDLRELVGMKLWHAGYAVMTADTGDDALAIIAHRRPDVVVLDVMMPGTDGLAVCRQLREDPQTATLPVIMLTARSHAAFVLEGFAAGATSYLTKPFSPRELAEEIKSLLGA